MGGSAGADKASSKGTWDKRNTDNDHAVFESSCAMYSLMWALDASAIEEISGSSWILSFEIDHAELLKLLGVHTSPQSKRTSAS